MSNPFATDLAATPANHRPLTPLTFLSHAATVFPGRTAVIHGDLRRSWRETAERCRRLASALAKRGIGRGDTVAVLLPNTPEMLECHFGVPLSGAVLNALNYRLDAASIAFILNHSEARVFIVDPEYAAVARVALSEVEREILLVDGSDHLAPPAEHPGAERLGSVSYDELLAEGDPAWPGRFPDDEWDAISLNYTSGTTGNPKGVVYHHRGAALLALGNLAVWGLSQVGAAPVYLWTLPMFHANGWCFPWTITALAGTHVCLRKVEARAIFDALADRGVTHLCGAPIVMQLLLGATPAERRDLGGRTVEFMTAAAPPPAAVLKRMAEQGFRVTHVYGLTEVYGPAVVCDWKQAWEALPEERQAELKARQGVAYPVLEGLMVADAGTLQPVPRDGATLGEVFLRGNVVMKGYLKNPRATAAAFRGGWFHSGDLGVWHPDGYIELKDRSKDIIISGGENISSIEVEGAFYKHPAVAAVAVVGRPDAKWGETPVAFVELKPGAAATEAALIAHARAQLAHYKVPRTVIFGPLPKTSTGKIQKFALRERAKSP
jgi:fatty-acyl-CoA synthase